MDDVIVSDAPAYAAEVSDAPTGEVTITNSRAFDVATTDAPAYAETVTDEGCCGC